MKKNSDSFKAKFVKVHREIDVLDVKTDTKEGIFFRNHTYTQDELLNSEHLEKVYSITGKIGDDVTNWHIRGKLSEEARNSYDWERTVTDNKLSVLKVKIAERKPTWWESFKSSVNSFVVLVMDNIPPLDGWLLDLTPNLRKYLPKPVVSLVAIGLTIFNNRQRGQKRLSHQEKNI